LVFSEAGRIKTVTLTKADVAEVAAAVARYQQAKAELERAAEAGVAELRARLAARRGRSR
jgi:alpha-D-ribose 1-methylphosphonate 5-triphosphate synthase subunit PhnG